MLYRSGQATDTLYIQGCSEETDIILFTIFTKPNVARMNFLMPNADAIHGNLFNRRLNFTFPTFQPREDIFDMAFVSAKLGYARRGRKGMSIFLGRRGVSKACFGLRPTYHLYSFRETCTSARVKTWQRGARFTLNLWGGGGQTSAGVQGNPYAILALQIRFGLLFKRSANIAGWQN